MNKVAVVKCANYEEVKIFPAIQNALELIGGVKKFISPGQKVLLKPNLAGPYSPERAITTHPFIIKALTKIFQSAGAKVSIADSPTGIHNPSYLKLVYKKTGMEEIADETGAELVYDTEAKEISYPQGKQIKYLTIFKPILDTDVLVSVAKLKTHLYTRFTGATKNLYGTIPGVVKVAYHSKFQDPDKFSQLLLDIHNYLKPKLSIIDGITGMEGNGPAWGKPKNVGVLIAGENALSCDWVSCQIIGINPKTVPILYLEKVAAPEIVGAEIKEVAIPDFLSPPPTTVKDGLIAIRWVPKFLRDRFGYHLLSQPRVNPEKCIACKICIEGCPQQTIELQDIPSPASLVPSPLTGEGKGEGGDVRGKAVIIEKNCIRCWCCSENCPEGAIELKQSFLGKLFTKLS